MAFCLEPCGAMKVGLNRFVKISKVDGFGLDTEIVFKKKPSLAPMTATEK